MDDNAVIRVAVATPLHQLFDYLPATNSELPPRGARVEVPFGRARKVGLVVECGVPSAVDRARLKPIRRIIDREPLIEPVLLELLLWAARYYCYPPGEVIAAALPALLRGNRSVVSEEICFQLTAAGSTADISPQAPRQQELVTLLRRSPDGLSSSELRQHTGRDCNDTLRRLLSRGWIRRLTRQRPPRLERGAGEPAAFELLPDQANAVDTIANCPGFAPFLLNGITGSGKTEVYLNLIEHYRQRSLQSLVLVPEIGLTPQLVNRFRKRLSGSIVVLHSGLSDSERLDAWRCARDGSAEVIVGTRSAVFVPMARPGLLVIDEEHDSSYKQQEGFRYSARDFAVVRARAHQVPVVLGSATPSLESLHNVAQDRYRELRLQQRPGTARLPKMRLLDMRLEPAQGGLSASLQAAMRRHLAAGAQVLLFLNRRGFAPAWYCIECSWLAGCQRCDARMTYHQRVARLRCHHCGAEQPAPPACPNCETPLQPVGAGTERIEQSIGQLFPDTSIARLDRDNTRRKGALEEILADIRSGKHRILVGTQMLTKGHHFPDVSLVGVVDADQGLFGTDPRSSERLAQLLIQVAGRAGRAGRAGEVLIQTHCPNHPLLTRLIESGYDEFAAAALGERAAAGWPPYSSLAMLRARAAVEDHCFDFLRAACTAAGDVPAGVRLLGPAAAPMARRAGQYRAQLLVQGERGPLHQFLPRWISSIATLPAARRVHWSADVDPLDLY